MVVAVTLGVALVLVLTVVLIGMLRRRAQLSVVENTGTWPAGGSLEDRLRMLLRQRQKIQAIKLVRQHTRLGLKEARDVVDEFERTDRLWLPGEARPGWPGEPDRPGKLWGPEPGEVLERARRLKAERKAIDAIKLIRSHTGLGLKEAKDLYDEL